MTPNELAVSELESRVVKCLSLVFPKEIIKVNLDFVLVNKSIVATIQINEGIIIEQEIKYDDVKHIPLNNLAEMIASSFIEELKTRMSLKWHLMAND